MTADSLHHRPDTRYARAAIHATPATIRAALSKPTSGVFGGVAGLKCRHTDETTNNTEEVTTY